MNAIDSNAPTAVSTLEAVRKRQARQFAARVTMIVVVPTLLVALYQGVIASRQYQSVAVLAVDSGQGGALLGVAPGTNLPRDAMMVREYALSRDVLQLLIDREGYREHYQQSRVDVVSRLRRRAKLEDVYAYFREHTEVDFDVQTSLLTLKVRAFSGRDARRFADAIVRACAEKMREVSLGMRRDRLHMAEVEAAQTAERLGAANAALGRSQGSGDAADLELSVVRKQTALEAYEAALRNLETARAEAVRQQAYVVVVTAPSLPDAGAFPSAWRGALATFLASAGLFIIGSIIIAVIREHSNV